MPKMALIGNKDVNPARDSVYIISFTPLLGPLKAWIIDPTLGIKTLRNSER